MSASTHSICYKSRLLVIRLSALGDVAILQPVLKARAVANPDVLFTIAGPPLLEPLFRGFDNIHYLPLRKRQPVRHLYRMLAGSNPTMVADMHHVNRTIGVDLLFCLHRTPVRHIYKDRRGKRQLVRNGSNHTAPLKPTWQRYDEVFERCGLAKGIIDTSFWPCKKSQGGGARIGIAPFAQHQGKIWPEVHVQQLIALLADNPQNTIFLFGGPNESDKLKQWASPYPNVHSAAAHYTFEQELQLIASLNVMVSMDSANMHFASCLGIPVVSIWGATHPAAGFYGWRQNPCWSLGVDLDCRPCSVFGDKPCRFGDYRCLQQISPQQVYQAVLTLI